MPRQHQVEDDDIVTIAGRQTQTRNAIAGSVSQVPFGFQIVDQIGRKVRVIPYHEDSEGGVHEWIMRQK